VQQLYAFMGVGVVGVDVGGSANEDGGGGVGGVGGVGGGGGEGLSGGEGVGGGDGGGDKAALKPPSEPPFPAWMTRPLPCTDF
jgi:hypothetical protein